MSDSALRDEVVELAQALIRLDTSNPPGNETPAAELLAEHLREAGAECELIGPDPSRLNLIARVPGSGEGPSVMLMAHTDVVPAPSDGWTVSPFGATLRDGRLFGRGAADMKGELAARAVALAEYARSGERPAGDLVLVAEADEERNTADVGMSWLVRERADVRCDYAINEGGGILLDLADGRRVVTISVGEKRVTSLRVRVHGTAGHASVPAAADNPLGHAAEATERLLKTEAPMQMTPAVDPGTRGAWRAARPVGVRRARVGRPAAPDPRRRAASDDQAHGHADGAQDHEPSNVIPPYVDVICDCRALPGQDEDDIRAHVTGALGDGYRYEMELLEPLAGGTESPVDTPLYEACREYVAARLPGAELLPLVNTGFTDSHWVRGEFGTVSYGFAPVFSMDLDAYFDGVHGADECLDVADLVEMTEFHLHALRALAR